MSRQRNTGPLAVPLLMGAVTRSKVCSNRFQENDRPSETLSLTKLRNSIEPPGARVVDVVVERADGAGDLQFTRKSVWWGR